MTNYHKDENLKKIFKIKKCSSKKIDDLPLFLDTKTLDIIKNLKTQKNLEFINKSSTFDHNDNFFKQDNKFSQSKVQEESNYNKIPSYQMSLEELEKIAFDMLKKKVKFNNI